MSLNGTWERLFSFHGQRNTRRRKGWRNPSEPDENRALADYMRDVGTTPLLERECEERHAATLHKAREAFAALVLELPSCHRRQVLNGYSDGPSLGGKWRLRKLEDCFDRMTAQLGASADRRVGRIMDEARQQKQLIDESRDALILANLRFVAHLAKQMSANSATFLEPREGALLAYARALTYWHQRHRHCGDCGQVCEGMRKTRCDQWDS